MLRKLGTTLALAATAVVLTSTLAGATEGLVSKIEENGAIVRIRDKDYIVGRIPGAKVGDKVTCTEASGRAAPGTMPGTTSGVPGNPPGTTSGVPGNPPGTPSGVPGNPPGTIGDMPATAIPAIQMTCTKM